jgi:hypothetical protein
MKRMFSGEQEFATKNGIRTAAVELLAILSWLRTRPRIELESRWSLGATERGRPSIFTEHETFSFNKSGDLPVQSMTFWFAG